MVPFSSILSIRPFLLGFFPPHYIIITTTTDLAGAHRSVFVYLAADVSLDTGHCAEFRGRGSKSHRQLAPRPDRSFERHDAGLGVPPRLTIHNDQRRDSWVRT